MTERPASIWTPSPNFYHGRIKTVSLIVIHATETEGIESPLSWLCLPTSRVSSHYLIAPDGVVHHLVHESDIAWHAGVSSWRGQSNVNEFSVGIELVGVNSYTPAQISACSKLVKCLLKDYSLSVGDVVGHLDIAPGRKTDPACFPWSEFRDSLA